VLKAEVRLISGAFGLVCDVLTVLRWFQLDLRGVNAAIYTP
jgi:hypothetical protein